MTAPCACFTDSGADGSGGVEATTSTSAVETTADGTSTSTSAGTTSSSGSETADASTSGTTTAEPTTATTGDPPTTTATTDDTTSTGTTGGVPPLCADDPDLVACYEFDDGLAGVVLVDGSSYGNEGSQSGVAAGPGIIGDAALTTATTLMVVPEAPSLVLDGPYTAAAWFRVDALPKTRSGILDRGGNYGVFYRADEVVMCRIANLTVMADAPAGMWHHVACIYDGASLDLYLGGVMAATLATNDIAPGSGPLVLANDSPEPIVDQALIGALDRVHVWSRALTVEDLCADYPNACP
ncbi:MAG: LamG domain-containing protein [Myxococcales bacterium]|nr:LamG domain-containing protein [Myxococcales bacterium]